MIVFLPWMPAALRPNASSPGAWRKKSEAAKKYKSDCAFLCRELPKLADGPRKLTVDFHPPDKRRRDLDNMFASFKQGIDAIAEAIGVDDYQFSFMIVRNTPVKGGCVVVEIGE